MLHKLILTPGIFSSLPQSNIILRPNFRLLKVLLSIHRFIKRVYIYFFIPEEN